MYSGRRRLLAATAAGAAALAAGCLGEDDGDGTTDAPVERGSGNPAGEDSPGDDHGDPSVESGTDVPIDEMATFPEDRSCELCNMFPARHPDWNAQLVHEDGKRRFFCTPGCAIGYLVSPETFGGPDEPVANLWVNDFEAREYVDGFEVHWVLEDDVSRVDDPMYNPYPFAEGEDALAFVDDHEDLDADDVVTTDAIDVEIAREYRGWELRNAD